MGGCLHHPPGIAGGTNTTPFKGERDEEIVTAAGTSGSSKTMGQNATRQILAKILFDVSSNRPARFPDDLASPDKPRCAQAVGADKLQCLEHF
jgi:hypothetical protein